LTKKLFNVKRKIRTINSIAKIEKLNSRTFRLEFKEEKESKAITYECMSPDNCSEIIAKLNFLMVRFSLTCQKNQEKPLTLKKNASMSMTPATFLSAGGF